MIRSAILSLAVVLTLSASASSREFLVGATIPTTASQQRFQPSAASDGHNFFSVWADARSGFGAVIGTRITRDGEVLDPLGLRIATATGSVSSPEVVWDGAAYLVVWTASVRGQDFDQDLFAARIAPNGGVVMAPRLIAENATASAGRYVASNGNVSVIAWLQGYSEVRVTTLDRDGNTLHHDTIPDVTGHLREPVIAAGTSRFVVAWRANTGFAPSGAVIRAATLTATGHRIGDAVTIGRGDHPAIGTDGTRFTVTSLHNEDWRKYTLLSRTFHGNLAPIGPEHALLVQRQIDHATVLWVGDHYEVLTVRQVDPGRNEIVTIELDGDGNPAQPPRGRGMIFGDVIFMRVGAATNGVDVLVARVGEGPVHVGTQIFGQLYPSNTSDAGVPLLLSWSGNAHRQPDIASSASGFFVAWSEADAIYSTRVDANGHSLDGRGIRHGSNDTGYFAWVSRPRVAFDGTNYVLAWAEASHVIVRYIAPLTGAMVAEARVPAEGWPSLALVTTPAATYLVTARGDVHVTRIPAATHTPDSTPLLVAAEIGAYDPAAAWNGSELLVAWTEHYQSRGDPPISFPIRVWAARVTAGLSLLDPSPLLVAGTPAGEEEELEIVGEPAVASNGTGWLIVTTAQDTDVVARRMSRGGMLEGGAPVKIGEGAEVAATWDGIRYVVAWKEGTFTDVARPLVLNAVPATGALVATNRSLVAAGTAFSRPNVASSGNGKTAVSYTKISFLPEHAGVERSFFREMDFTTVRGRVVRR